MKQLLACLILLLFAFGTKAQTIDEFRKMPAQEQAQRIADTLKTGLNLSNEQYNTIYNIAFTTTAKADPIMNSDASRRSKAMKVIPMWRDAEKSMKAVLTPAQADLYESKKNALIAEVRANIGKQPIHFN